jgi:hypothetical protein
MMFQYKLVFTRGNAVSEHTWEGELERFSNMSQLEQLYWLSNLLYLLSMFARDTYEVGTDGVSKPNDLRRFNELVHRVATFQRQVAMSDVSRMSNSDLFDLIEQHMSVLELSDNEVLCRLS